MKDSHSIQHNWPLSDTTSSRQVSTGSTRCRRSTCAVQQAVDSVDHHVAALPLLRVIASVRLHSTNQNGIINLCIRIHTLESAVIQFSSQLSRRLMCASTIDRRRRLKDMDLRGELISFMQVVSGRNNSVKILKYIR